MDSMSRDMYLRIFRLNFIPIELINECYAHLTGLFKDTAAPLLLKKHPQIVNSVLELTRYENEDNPLAGLDVQRFARSTMCDIKVSWIRYIQVTLASNYVSKMLIIASTLNFDIFFI